MPLLLNVLQVCWALSIKPENMGLSEYNGLRTTVPTFNAWTKCVGIDNRTTECSFDPQASWAVDVRGLYVHHVIHGSLYNEALEDTLTTGAGIKCLYCTYALHVGRALYKSVPAEQASSMAVSHLCRQCIWVSRWFRGYSGFLYIQLVM